MMPTLLRKRHRLPSGHASNIGQGTRIHTIRQRLVHPQQPVQLGASSIPAVPAPLPLVPPSCFAMGTDLDTGRELYLRQERFERQPHLLFSGAPGVGKTVEMLIMIDALLAEPQASLFLLNPKGSLGRRAVDLVLARGQAQRLEVLDPSEEEYIPSYNPAHPNSLSWCVHAKQLREGIRQSTNMTSFDVAQQMQRVLFMFLAMTKLFDLTLAETAQLVRPKSALRRQLIPKVPDPDLRFALEYFDGLPERRQDELGSSSLARLESFCFDPMIKRITSRKGPSIDIGDIISNHKILVADIRESDPLRVDDARLLGRFLVNDIVAHVFGRKGPITPVYLVMDEAYAFMTDDLAKGLDRGREPGLHVWLACQYIDQFILEDGNTRIRDSVKKCIENRIIFRTPDIDDCKEWAKQLYFDTYTPWAVKHARESIEAEPVETTRKVTGSTHSASAGTAVADSRSSSRGFSASDGVSISHGASRAESETWNSSDTRGTSMTDSEATAITQAELRARTVMNGEALTEMEGTSKMDGRGQMRSKAQAHADVSMDATAIGLTGVYDAPVPVGLPNTWLRSESVTTGRSASDQEAASNGETRFQADGVTRVEGRTVQRAEAETSALTLGRTDTIGRATTVSAQHTKGYAFGLTRTQSEERGRSQTATANQSATEGVTHTSSREESRGTSESEVPFITFAKKDVILDVQYLSEDEQMSLKAQEIQQMPNQCYFLQLATLATRRMRAQDWRMPALSEEARAADWLAIHTRPTYTPVAQIEAEEQERNKRQRKGARSQEESEDSDASPKQSTSPNFWS
jgi:DNA polymerase III delta prime subunit